MKQRKFEDVAASDWFLNRSGYVSQEARAFSLLEEALDWSRTKGVERLLERQSLTAPWGYSLGAANRWARIRWARAVAKEFVEHHSLTRKRNYPSRPVYFLTLASVVCTTSVEARDVYVDAYKALYRDSLRGVSYIGMIEPGLYANIGKGAWHDQTSAVCWHVHALVWGLSFLQSRDLEARLNKEHRAIAPGLDAARIRQIPVKSQSGVYHLADKFRYLMKSPKEAYRVWPLEYVTRDGEIIRRGFRQKGSSLRRGERRKLFYLLRDLYLDQLALGGGEGALILRKAKRAALSAPTTMPLSLQRQYSHLVPWKVSRMLKPKRLRRR